MSKIVDWYFRLLKFIVAACLTSMVLLVFGNVVLRYIFHSGIAFSEEFSRWLFVWLTFFGAIVALKEHTHLGMDALVSKLPVIGKKICFVASHVIMIGCTIMMLFGGWQQTIINIPTVGAASGLSAGLLYGVTIIFGVSALCILFYDLFMMLTGKTREKDLIQIRESEEEMDEETLKRKLQALNLDNPNTHAGSPDHTKGNQS